MIQFVLENPDKLIHIITHSIAYECEILRIKLINTDLMNFLIIHTTLPLTLIDIIDSYTNDVINISVSQKIKQQQKQVYVDQYPECGLHQVIHKCFYFNTHSFNSVHYVKYKRIYSHVTPQGSEHNWTSTLSIKNNKAIEHKMFEHSTLFEYPKKYKRRRVILKKIANDTPWFLKISKQLTDKNIKIRDTFDWNIFFDCYINNTNNHYIIDYDKFSIKLCNNGLSMTSKHVSKNYVEECYYNNENDCYNHIMANRNNSKLTQYKIIDHEQLLVMIAINKLLSEIINEQLRNMKISENDIFE